jgi:hypothetical protein
LNEAALDSWLQAEIGAPPCALPQNINFDKMQTLDRLTSAGWSVIHRSDLIATCALLIAAMSLGLAIFGIAHQR